MRILHSQNPDCGYEIPGEPSVRPKWRRVFGWFEDEAIRPIEIDRECPLQISGQLMTPTWEGSHYLKILGSPKLIESAPHDPRPLRPEGLRQLFVRVIELGEPRPGKEYLHAPPLCQ